MRTRRSLQFASATVVALLAAGATFAWAGALVGGHRADHIGTFEPVSQRLVPAGSPSSSAATVTSQPKTTTASPASTVASPPSYSLAPTSPSEPTSTDAPTAPTTGSHHSDGSTTPTTDDNGRSHDD